MVFHRPPLAMALPVALAVIGACLYAAAFFPGAIGFDSAYQWWQARGGETSNIHGIAMTWLWRMSDLLAAGPGPLFGLQIALFWGGITWFALALPAGALWRITLMLAAACAPVCFVLCSYVSSDAMLMAVLTLAVAIVLREDGRPRWLVAASALLFFALCLRKNALAAAVPLLVYIFFVARRAVPDRLRWRRIVVYAATVALALQCGALLLERTVDRRVSILAGTALWDLAAISLDANEILLPPASHGPGLDLDDLRGAFVAYSGTTLFERTHAGIHLPFFEPGDPLESEIWKAWRTAIVEHPRAYLAHRWRVACALFGSKQREWPRELSYITGVYQYAGNPPVQVNRSGANAGLLQLFDAVRDSSALAAWPYLVGALCACAFAWRRRAEAHARLALAVLGSGLLYALPLLAVAPSVELRYLGWTCLSAILGIALVFAPRINDDAG